MTSKQGVDSLTVSKTAGSDWANVEMEINDGAAYSQIDLRSREMTEQLHFMLGQLLRTPDTGDGHE